MDPTAYARLIDGLNRFADNRVLWESGMDTSLLRKHMVFTLCAPGGRADRARKAVDKLAELGYLGDPGWDWDSQADDIIRPLVRFPKQKAKRIAICLINFETMRQELPLIRGNMARRKWLEKTMPGYGPKAATHFMRNTGLMHYNDGLPIIDVHIHKVLEYFGFKHSKYEESCASFTSLARLVDIPVSVLDAVLWCAYSGNWKVDGADFDNFGVTEPLKIGTVKHGKGRDKEDTSIRCTGNRKT